MLRVNLRLIALFLFIIIIGRQGFALNCQAKLEGVSQGGFGSIKHSNSSLLAYYNIEPSELNLKSASNVSTEKILQLVRELQHSKFQKGNEEILRFYYEFTRHRGVTPEASDLSQIFAEAGFNVNFQKLVGQNLAFDSMDDLRRMAIEKYPAVKKALDSSYSSEQIRRKIKKSIEKTDAIYVCSAVNGAPVHRVAFEEMLRMAKINNATVLIRPINMNYDEIDPYIKEATKNNPNVFISIDEIELNPWWVISDIPIIAKMLNPNMGIQGLWARGRNQVIAAPRIELETVATADNVYFPHRVLNTAAITIPNYAGEKHVQGRTDKMALALHEIGFLVLEKTQYKNSSFGLNVSGNFHPRHVRFVPEAKGFVDLGTLYTKDGVKRSEIVALILGDIHVGDTDPRLLLTIKDVIKKFKPKQIILHDLMNGHSVNPHEKDQLATLARQASAGKLDIAQELSDVANFVNALLEIDESLEVVILRANHPDWLMRWTQGNYLVFPQNRMIYNRLQEVNASGENVFKYALLNGVGGSVTINKHKRVIFPAGSSYKVAPKYWPFEAGFHGDKGANGAKGSKQSFVRGMGRGGYGHTHTTSIKNGTYNVGTSTHTVLGYMDGGFSSWAQSMALVGVYGEVQLLINDNGELFADPSYRPTPSFFMEGYPNIIPKIQPPPGRGSAGQIDQYSH